MHTDAGKESKSYTFEHLGHIKEVFSLGRGEPMVQPLIKTETVYGGQGGANKLPPILSPIPPLIWLKFSKNIPEDPEKQKLNMCGEYSLMGATISC